MRIEGSIDLADQHAIGMAIVVQPAGAIPGANRLEQAVVTRGRIGPEHTQCGKAGIPRLPDRTGGKKIYQPRLVAT